MVDVLGSISTIHTNLNNSPHILFFQVIAEMTDGGVDRSVECTGNIDAMISAFECVHDVMICFEPQVPKTDT